jgi:hypothetical protein
MPYDEMQDEEVGRVVRRPGTRILYEIKKDEKWIWYGDNIIICHPDRVPIMIKPDGTLEEIKP